ncbi:pentatricopeptide repeat-containing protein At4g18840 [Magnolia sinica]|uniref:pentatricopeptide repeat-containing protein At4g18840 n=1 Tax=Magnolia sinica TaxID=86752 RepID=UPI002659F7E0|nr:pentatricopeptide repeat-containing protein At4g18840 [Magnolia sinica]
MLALQMAANSSPPPILSIIDMSNTLSEVQQAHAHMLKTGLIHTTFAASRIVAFAATVSDAQTIAHARSVFDRIATPNSYTWNTIIRAYANSADPENAILLFHQMLHSDVLPDKFTYPFILKACSRLHGFEEGRQIHATSVKTGVDSDIFVQNTLIHMYASLGHTRHAYCLFDRMSERDVISWNAILSAFVARGLMEQARRLFDQMPDRNVESWNFVISGYVDLGLIDDAQSLFDGMPTRDVVSWNAMITGYVHAGRFREALELFGIMQNAEVRPDNCTFVNLLSACARIGALSQGEWIHTYINKNEIQIDGFLATALVDMYSKCGSIEKALRVFRDTSKKDISTWNSMIAGLSTHGYGECALRLFSEMLMDEFAPNEITFISILSACSHAGLLHEGRRVFELMTEVHGIQPTVEHYGCMVDLLGRAGLLNEAQGLVSAFPCKDSPVVWESLLAACRSHGNIELAEHVAGQLLELNPQDNACYVQLSNIYESAGRWDDVREVREKMRKEGVRKEPGCSMIDVDGIVHEFSAGDRSHPQADEIYRKVDEMKTRIRSIGYVPDTSQVLFEIGEDEKESALLWHSEKLAIAFGLLNSGEDMTIRIIKNLKMCGDCHSAIKLISRAYGREIVVRDKNRFHHFKNGCCSCNDYW